MCLTLFERISGTHYTTPNKIEILYTAEYFYSIPTIPLTCEIQGEPRMLLSTEIRQCSDVQMT